MVFITDILRVFEARRSQRACVYLCRSMRSQTLANELPHGALFVGAALAPTTNFIQRSPATFAIRGVVRHATNRDAGGRWCLVALQHPLGLCAQAQVSRREALGFGGEFASTHGLHCQRTSTAQASRLFMTARDTRELGLRPKASLMNTPASINLSRSMPVSMPMPCIMYTTSSVATFPVAPLA